MSLPEVMLWQRLRSRPYGLKFRRQHPLGPYILDFYCPAAKLVIEIDGESHGRGDRPQRDQERTSFLERLGLTVVRVAAGDVLSSVDKVAGGIARASLPLHQPAAGPPPHALHGEDL